MASLVLRAKYSRKRKFCVGGSAFLLAVVGTSFLGCGGGEPASGLSWTYGGSERPVLSWPVLDEAGNIFVLVGAEATRQSIETSFDVQAVELVSLDSSGALRWSYSVFGPATVTEAVTRPSVHEGDVWVYFRDRILRISGAGELRWILHDVPSKVMGSGWPLDWTDSSRTALDAAGNFYFMPFVTAGPGMQRQELWAISSDGRIRWRGNPTLEGGNGGEDDLPPPDQTEAPLVAPDGTILTGCTTCVAGRAGLARSDPNTGVASLLYSDEIGGGYVTFANVLWDGASVWYEVTLDEPVHWQTRLDGSTTQQSHALTLVTNSGPVWIEDERHSSGDFVMHWGSEVARLDMASIVTETDARTRVRPLAATEPAAVLVQVLTSKESSLALFDVKGNALWHTAGGSDGITPVPIIYQGSIVYIDNVSRRLISESVPVASIAQGPCPMLGGTAQNTRNAQSRIAQ